MSFIPYFIPMGEEFTTLDWWNDKKDHALPVNQNELAQNLDIPANPYPAGHFCAKLYDIFATKSAVAANKMYNNIKINALWNIEVFDREYMVLTATPGKNIKERNGEMYFIGESDVQEVEKLSNLGWELPEMTVEEADAFINLFPSTDGQLASNMWNMFRIFKLYTHWLNDGFWDWDNKERLINGQAYVIFAKKKLWAHAYVDDISKKYNGDIFTGREDHGYRVIVSRPIQK